MTGVYEEDLSFESMEELQQSCTIELHESLSCQLLLPCGLLPEELEELECITSMPSTPIKPPLLLKGAGAATVPALVACSSQL
jgi:hypothetical protein